MVAPRVTFARLVFQHEGRLWEVLPWMMVVTAAVSPGRAGRALLLGRADVLDGLMIFLNALSQYTIGPLVGVATAALLLVATSRLRGSATPIRFEAALDGCAFLLMPFLLLCSLGVILEAAGWDFWFLPHNGIRGRGTRLVVRVAVAFGWSGGLFILGWRTVFLHGVKAPGKEASVGG